MSFVFAMIVFFMMVMIIVYTDAGIFLEAAGRAAVQIQVKLFNDHFREGNVGNQSLFMRGKVHAGGIGAVSADQANFLIRNGRLFPGIIEG